MQQGVSRALSGDCHVHGDGIAGVARPIRNAMSATPLPAAVLLWLVSVVS